MKMMQLRVKEEIEEEMLKVKEHIKKIELPQAVLEKHFKKKYQLQDEEEEVKIHVQSEKESSEFMSMTSNRLEDDDDSEETDS